MSSSNDYKLESAGTVTSDSLAGESLASGGDFGSTTNAAASAQPSASTNTNNTDISGARTLDAAPDAEARQAGEEWSEAAQFNAGRTLSESKAYNTTTGSGSNGGTAPSYANATGATSGPAGDNLTEGGFDSDGPNASYGTDIGGKKDPGREALLGFQKSGARAGADAGNQKDDGLTDQGQYSALGGETSS